MLNAIESIDDNGKLIIDISARPDDEPYARIAITDTGCGIPESEVHRIFDRYQTTKESGTGLGLASVVP